MYMQGIEFMLTQLHKYSKESVHVFAEKKMWEGSELGPVGLQKQIPPLPTQI